MGIKVILGMLLLLGILHADTQIQALQSELDLLKQRLDAFEKAKQEEHKRLESQKGILELTSDKTILGVGGRIDLQSIWGWPEGSLFADQRIPLDKLHERGQLHMSARDSRLWIKSRTPTQYGPLRTLIEVDFWGSNGNEKNVNGHGPRLRHAYIQMEGLIVGQTNSAFNAFVTVDTITFIINDAFVRQPLIRFMKEEKEIAYDISFEQPETTLVDKRGVILTPQDDIVPDVIARVRYYPSWGEAAFAVMGRYITQNHAALSDGTSASKKDAAFGYGVNLSAKIKTYNKDDLRFDGQYGKGMGRYMAYNAYAAGFINDNGDIQLQESYGAHIGYRHWWAKEWRSTLAFGYAATKNNDKILLVNRDLVNKNASSMQANIFWNFVPNSIVGVEYVKGYREVQSKENGDMDMVLLVFRYDF